MIDEDTYRIKKENLVKQKIALKDEKNILGQTRMSGWIEPTIDYIKTLEKAKNINDSDSPAEISQFLEKIGTNRSISNKKISWNFLEPFDFSDSILARPAPLSGERGLKKSANFPLSPVQ